MIRGYTIAEYMGLVGVTVVSMLAGASCVHIYYKPNLAIPEAPPERRKRDTNAPFIEIRK
eukprot:m.242629 g.242629  ORF g.242629 m.242629 type:complete len:60 (-) comp14074_c0_seq1:60-239(-)